MRQDQDKRPPTTRTTPGKAVVAGSHLSVPYLHPRLPVVPTKAMTDKAPPMVAGDASTDRAYLEKHGVQEAIATALARVVREKPAEPLRLIAQMLSPATHMEPVAAPAATPTTTEPAGEDAAPPPGAAAEAAGRGPVAL